MEIITPRLRLRPWARGDEEALVRYADNPRISAMLRDRFPNPYTRADADWWIANVADQQPPVDFAIVVAGEPVGGIGVSRLEDAFRIGGELGYWLAESCWGRGYASEAVAAMVPYAFDTLGLNRLQASVFAPNISSARVLEKNGFALEGRLRGAVLKGGAVHDVLVYGRLRGG